jgi:hypothetical protein
MTPLTPDFENGSKGCPNHHLKNKLSDKIMLLPPLNYLFSCHEKILPDFDWGAIRKNMVMRNPVLCKWRKLPQIISIL